jgi:hypothetical protein
MFDVAIKHMLEVIICSHQSKATQELFLTDFFQTVQKIGKTFEVARLQLPVVVIPSLKIVFEDHRTYASAAAVTVKESVWQSLEEDMIPTLTGGRTNWLELHSKILSRKEKNNVCVAGEAIAVEIGFKNPLQISVSVSNICLVCEHSPISDENIPDPNMPVSARNAESTTSEYTSGMSSYTLSEVDISLAGGETIVAQVTVTPKEEGLLKIVGVRWKLSGSVIGFHAFEHDLVRKKVTNGRRAKPTVSSSLKFIVIKSLPRLEGLIDHFPKTVYAGDLRRLSLELTNPSEIPVKNMKMKISHPRFLNVGNRAVMDMEFPSCLERTENSGQSQIEPTNKASDSVFLFPDDTVIHGDAAFLWPLWLWAAAPGNISLDIVIFYEMEEISTAMKYRTLRMHYDLEVVPSLNVSFHISPGPSRSLQEFLVKMDVVNSTTLKSFKVHQLSCVGKNWSINPINDSISLQFLMPGQALSSCFKLKKAAAEENVSSNVRLSDGSSENLFDIYSSPLIDFHHCERGHQQPLDQAHQNSVDFVLISWPHKNETDTLNIFSHHTCHCSIASTSPIWWLMDGPRTVRHNFSTPFVEIKLKMTLHNSSDSAASVRIDTHDASSQNPVNEQVGWHDLSQPPTDPKVAAGSSDISSTTRKSPPPPVVVPHEESCASPPFIWSGSSSTRVKLEPRSTNEIPLVICVFSPGTYDLSNYDVDWSLVLPSSTDGYDDVAGKRHGSCQGHPYYLTVLDQQE